jgi:hypothetical protein
MFMLPSWGIWTQHFHSKQLGAYVCAPESSYEAVETKNKFSTPNSSKEEKNIIIILIVYTWCFVHTIMMYVLFWDITQCCVVIVYRRFGTTYRSHFHGSRVRVGKKEIQQPMNLRYRLLDFFLSYLDSWHMKMGPIRCPETSVNNCHTTLCIIPEEHRSHQHRGGSLKSTIMTL